MLNNQRITYLWQQYLAEQATPAELNELLGHIQQTDKDEENTRLIQESMGRYSQQTTHSGFQAESWEKVKALIAQQTPAIPSLTVPASAKGQPAAHPIHFLRNRIFRYAAAIILTAGTATLIGVIATRNHKPETTLADGGKPLDIAPGDNRAVLTLADGTSILLDSAGNGALAQQGNVTIVKLSDGQVAYDLKGKATGEVMMNTMSTPRGGQYQLTLPDGTKVWLNAASSITYPALFAEKNRKVRITGEAYFEVAKKKEQPFIVDVDGRSSIEVLGTHFNVNAYTDERNIKTSLMEGSINVRTSDKQAVLKPGQQASIVITASPEGHSGKTNAIAVSDDADLDQALAWKNGLFNFNGADLPAIMRQLERWYDIKVKYEGRIPDLVFKGKMYRNVHLSDVMAFFKNMNVDMRLDGKTLIIQ